MPIKNEAGHWRDKKGDYVHPDLVSADKKLEDDVVRKLVEAAKKEREALIEFKTRAFEECYTFMELLRERYGMKRITGHTGAVTLKSYDGTQEVVIAVAKIITFDAKLNIAKEKIDEYLAEKTEHADAEIQTLITRAFDVKNGKVDAKQIISLKSYDIKHPKWIEAMSMIDEATEIAGTKSYVRFKEREGGEIDGELNTILLDIAKVPVRKPKSDEEAGDE